jgi:hypothetical protein
MTLTTPPQTLYVQNDGDNVMRVCLVYNRFTRYSLSQRTGPFPYLRGRARLLTLLRHTTSFGQLG